MIIRAVWHCARGAARAFERERRGWTSTASRALLDHLPQAAELDSYGGARQAAPSATRTQYVPAGKRTPRSVRQRSHARR